MTTRKIVTLCGSTRFYSAFQEANYRETMKGNIVLSVGFYPDAGEHHEERGCTPQEKEALDILHFDKIMMSDEILVLNVGGYVGESTSNEIALAVYLDKSVRWLEEPPADWLKPHNALGLMARIRMHREAGR